MDWERALLEDVASRRPQQARAPSGLDARHLLGDEAPVGLDLLAEPGAEPDAESDVGASWGGRAEETAARAAVARARTALGFDQRSGLQRVRLEVRLEVDRLGACRAVEQRTGWRAVVEGVESFPVATLLPARLPTPPEDRPAVVVEALAGCTPGPSYVDLGAGLAATALTFPAPLAQGQEVTTVHRVEVPSASSAVPAPAGGAGAEAAGGYVLQLLGAVDEVRLQVVSDQQVVPLVGEVHLCTGAGRRVESLSVREGSLAWSGEMPEPGELLTRWCW